MSRHRSARARGAGERAPRPGSADRPPNDLLKKTCREQKEPHEKRELAPSEGTSSRSRSQRDQSSLKTRRSAKSLSTRRAAASASTAIRSALESSRSPEEASWI